MCYRQLCGAIAVFLFWNFPLKMERLQKMRLIQEAGSKYRFLALALGCDLCS